MLLCSSKNDEDDSGLDQSCARFDDDKVSINGVAKATGLCFLDDGMDWRLSGEFGPIRAESPLVSLLFQLRKAGCVPAGDRAEHHGTRRQRCSQQEYHDQVHTL